MDDKQEKQEPSVEPSKPPLVLQPRKPTSSGLLLAHALAAGGMGNRLIVPTPAPEPVRTPEELARAEAVSTAKISAAEAKRQRRQQRNLKR